MAGRLGHHLPALVVVEQHRPALGLELLHALAGDVAEESLLAPGQGEGPGHLVEAQELLALALKHPVLGLDPQEPAHPHLQLGGIGGLADDLRGLRRSVADVVLVEDHHRKVGPQGLAHAARDRSHVGVDDGERDQEEVGPAVQDLLDDPPAGDDDGDAVADPAEHLRERLGPLDVFVDEGDMSEGDAALEGHAWPGLPVRSMLVKRVTIERRAARAMGFTR